MHRSIKKSDMAGFTLIEIALAIFIASILLGGALFLLDRAENAKTYATTYENMDKVIRALGKYVEASSRAPCPADPGQDNEMFGWEWGTPEALIGDLTDDQQTTRPAPAPDGACDGPGEPPCTCRTWGDPSDNADDTPKNIGIVPFLSLGLDPDDIRDGWGRYFTYAVSPVFAQINEDINQAVAPLDPETGTTNELADEQGVMHVDCLYGSWYDGGDVINGPKAKYCCTKNGNAAPFLPATDINIQYTDGTAIWPNDADGEIYNDTRDVTANYYYDVDPPQPDAGGIDGVMMPIYMDPAGDAQITTTAVAVTLISHGENGLGAFLGNDTRGKFTGGVPNAFEIENGAIAAGGVTANSFDPVFMEGQKGNAFDDIVIWRTQEGLLAEVGSSCRYP